MKNLRHARGRAAIAVALGATLALAFTAPAAASNATRPFVGHAMGTSTITPIVGAIPDCPAGSMFLVKENGTGTFTHLGRVDYILQQCAAVNFNTGEGWTTKNGSMTLIAANGDRLVLSYEMKFIATPLPVPKTAIAHLDWTVASGTGRFAAPSGEGEATWSVVYTPDLSGADSVSVWSGTIGY